ncbi:hypothetical protein GW17_00049395 [Ensete ventricosum]|nr:hypothetical protein GW17_00049395 [Ensete ventricosum]
MIGYKESACTQRLRSSCLPAKAAPVGRVSAGKGSADNSHLPTARLPKNTTSASKVLTGRPPTSKGGDCLRCGRPLLHQ